MKFSKSKLSIKIDSRNPMKLKENFNGNWQANQKFTNSKKFNARRTGRTNGFK
ncbi:hypothetical protein CDIMF43_310050 [Carnobacterium divergens]|nr:hypothetical protein CDIMF43_310050 [Carnobacterium divergens]